MNGKTKYGVYNDINLSTYNLKFNFGIYEYNIYFSSKFYKNKFKNNYEQYVENEYLKIKNRYNINEKMADIEELKKILIFDLYSRIEKRGIKIYYKKAGDEKWQEVIK